MNKIARWRCIAVACAIVVLLPLASLAIAATQDVPELERWQRRELQTLVGIVAAALRGELVQLDDPFTVRPDFLKGTDGLTYVPFTLTLDPEQVSGSSLAVYLSVIPHQEAASAESNGDDLPEAVFEDAYFVDVSAARGAGGPIELSRAFTAAGGRYDVYVALRESLGPDADEDDVENGPVMMTKTEVDVPDYWNGELQTSSVILAQGIEPLNQPLTPEQQAENPYTLGTTRILPKLDRNFAKSDELSLIMLVYNPGVTSDQKPNLTIEYNFHQKSDDGEEFFNKTNPQEFNGQTLPPGFDLSAGHQIVAGQAVPLASFPAGDYRLEIIVTDALSGSSLTQNVNFSISE